MRHVESVLVALLAGPLTFILAGRGLGGLAEVAAEAPAAARTDYFAIATAAAAVGLAGLLFALLTMARLSPLGPTLAGAGLLTIGIWALAAPDQLHSTLPTDQIGLTADQLSTAAAVSPLLAVPLLVTLWIPRRWRGHRRVADEAAPPDHPLAPPAAPPPAPPPAYLDEPYRDQPTG